MAVVVRITRPLVQVAPGGRDGVTVEVTNVSEVVERFDLEVLGDAAGWAAVQPGSVTLMPGEVGRAEVVFTPALAPAPPAGPTPFAVRAVSSRDAAVRMVAEATVDVLPSMAFEVDVRPRTSEGARSGRHEVIVTNRGNQPARTVVTADDPDDLLAIEVEPAELVLEPGYEAVFRLHATTMRGRSRQPQRQPFTVHVRPDGHPGVDSEAAFVLSRRRSPVPLVVAAVVVLAAGIGAVVLLGDDGPIGNLIAGATTTEATVPATPPPTTAAPATTAPPPTAAATTRGAVPTSAATVPPSTAPVPSPTPAPTASVPAPTTATTAGGAVASKAVPVRAAGQRFGTTTASPCAAGARGQGTGRSTTTAGGSTTTTAAATTTTSG